MLIGWVFTEIHSFIQLFVSKAQPSYKSLSGSSYIVLMCVIDDCEAARDWLKE